MYFRPLSEPTLKNSNLTVDLAALFENYIKLVYKVCGALGLIRFVDICTDRRCASYNLVNKHAPTPTGIYLITDGNYMYGKRFCSCAKF